MARRVDDAPPLPEGYRMRAIPKAMAALADVPLTDDDLDRFADDRALGRRDADLGILG